MENLNAEQVIKELENQTKFAKFTNSTGVLLSAKCAQFCLDHVQYYEQMIKELTEENERLRAIPEELHKEMSERTVEERKIERKLAVRKMQERLDKHFCHDPAFLGVEQRLIMDIIDQIAKEMLEGTNDEAK